MAGQDQESLPRICIRPWGPMPGPFPSPSSTHAPARKPEGPEKTFSRIPSWNFSSRTPWQGAARSHRSSFQEQFPDLPTISRDPGRRRHQKPTGKIQTARHRGSSFRHSGTLAGPFRARPQRQSDVGNRTPPKWRHRTSGWAQFSAGTPPHVILSLITITKGHSHPLDHDRGAAMLQGFPPTRIRFRHPLARQNPADQHSGIPGPRAQGALPQNSRMNRGSPMGVSSGLSPRRVLFRPIFGGAPFQRTARFPCRRMARAPGGPKSGRAGNLAPSSIASEEGWPKCPRKIYGRSHRPTPGWRHSHLAPRSTTTRAFPNRARVERRFIFPLFLVAAPAFPARLFFSLADKAPRLPPGLSASP